MTSSADNGDIPPTPLETMRHPNTERYEQVFYSEYLKNQHIEYLRTLGCQRITEVQYSDGSFRVIWHLATPSNSLG